MRLVFAGTPEFAATSLQALIAAGHQIVAVLSQPDRHAGRGMRVEPGPVKRLAQSHGIPVFQPASLASPETLGELAPWFVKGKADLVVVAAYGLILPQAVLALPRLGCLNIHASLLPRWRGAAPIERALIAGDPQTGVSIMQMDRGMDTGPVLLARTLAIEPRDTGGSLRERLAILGAATLSEVLAALDRGDHFAARPQIPAGATQAPKIDKREAAIVMTRSAAEIDRWIRALDPVPGAFSLLRGMPIKFWKARAGAGADARELPGTVRAVGSDVLMVACGADGRGTLVVEELQRPGGKRLPAAEFLRGFPVVAGDRFGNDD